MDVEGLWHSLVDALEKAAELLMSVTRPALGEHGAGGDVEGGKQRRGAVAHIIVGDAFDIAEPHRQHRLGAIERLNLALLVDRQHHGMVGRI
jgi:hypothetical protein